MTTKNVSISISHDLLTTIDEQRGDVPRSAFCRRLILKALDESQEKKGGRSK